MTLTRLFLKRTLAVAVLSTAVSACGLHEPYVSGIGSLSGEARRGFECKGQRHSSGLPYVTEGSDGGLYSFGVCPDTPGYAERKATFVKTNPDIPRLPVLLPGGGSVQP